MTQRANKLMNKKNKEALTCCVLQFVLEFLYIHVMFYRITENGRRVQTSTAWSRWKSLRMVKKMQLST